MEVTTKIAKGDSYFPGSIQMIIGPMFAGKSTELLRRIKRYEVAKKKCLLIKYINDDRYSKDCISTHDKQTVFALPCDKLSMASHLVKDYEVIGIDEGQFFPDLVSFSEDAANMGKVVIVSALDGTFQRKSFGKVLELIPLAESVIKLNAVCMVCCNDASFTARTVEEKKTELIGGAESYKSVCRKCFHGFHISEEKP